MYLKMKTNYMDISNLLDPIIFKTSPKCTTIQRCIEMHMQNYTNNITIYSHKIV